MLSIEMENELKSIKNGMSMMDFIKKSNGHIISTSGGEGFVIFRIKGFLNSESGYRWGEFLQMVFFQFGLLVITKEIM